MDIVTFKCDTNYFTSLTFSLLKIDNYIYKDLNDLEKNVDDLKKNMVFLIFTDFGITKKFVDNLNEIKNLNQNCILSSINIYNNLKNKEEIVDYQPIQDSNFLQEKTINGFLVKKDELKKLLKNKEIDSFKKLTENINFEKICLYDCLSKIKFINNMIDDNGVLFCKNFKNPKNIENIQNIKSSFFSFLSRGKINQNYKNQIVKIYNEVHAHDLNNCIIDCMVEDVEDIINEYSKSPLNISFNNLYLLNKSNKNLDKFDLKSNVIHLDKDFKNCYEELLADANLNFDFYFINSLHKMKSIHRNEKPIVIFTKEKGYEIFKIKCYLIKFFKFDFLNFDDFIKKMANVVLNFLQYHLFIKDEPINLNVKIPSEKFVPNIKLIDDLYLEKEYDECCFLINLIIRNKLSFNFSFIYKTLVLVDKVNHVINKNEIKSLLSILKIDAFEDFFNIVVVLIHNKCKDLAFKTYFTYMLENEIKEENILQVLLLSKWLDVFTLEVDISSDKVILNNMLNQYLVLN